MGSQAYTTPTVRRICTFAVLFSVSRPFWLHAPIVFVKGTLFCVIMRIFKLIKFTYVINMKYPEIKNQRVIVNLKKSLLFTVFYCLAEKMHLNDIPVRVLCCIQSRCLKEKKTFEHPSDNVVQLIDSIASCSYYMWFRTQSANSELMKCLFINIFFSEKIQTTKTSPLRLQHVIKH